MLLAELGDVVGDQQQLRQPSRGDRPDLGRGLLPNLRGRFAPPCLCEAFWQNLFDQFGQTLEVSILNWRQAKKHERAVALVRRRVCRKRQAKLNEIANLGRRCQRCRQQATAILTAECRPQSHRASAGRGCDVECSLSGNC